MTDKQRTAQLVAAATHIKTVGQLAMLVSLEDAIDALNEAKREETVAAILDPTFYRANMDGMHDNVGFLRAFVDFRRALAKLVED